MAFDPSRLATAFAIAARAHAEQYRKGTTIPYLAHPMAVASLVIEFGGHEDQVLAALLHDAIEDGGSTYAAEIRNALGTDVIALVEACSDGTAEAKAAAVSPEAKQADWRRRKDAYLERLKRESAEALLVTA